MRRASTTSPRPRARVLAIAASGQLRSLSGCCSGVVTRTPARRPSSTSAESAETGPSARTATPASRTAGTRSASSSTSAADALAQGCDTLVSIGGVQSNHTPQVAAVGGAPRLACVLVQEHWVEGYDPGYETLGTPALADHGRRRAARSGAGFDIGVRQSWEEALRRGRGERRQAYPIPAGAPTIRWRARLRSLGRRERRRRSAESGSLRTDRRLLGYRLDAAGMSPASRRRSASARCWARRLGHGRSRRWDQIARIADAPPRRSASAARSRTSRSSCSTSGTRHVGIPDEKTSTRSVSARGSRGCSPTRSTRGSRWPRRSTRPRGRIEPGSKLLYAHLVGQPALHAYATAPPGAC